jgi:hypothetical protein
MKIYLSVCFVLDEFLGTTMQEANVRISSSNKLEKSSK